MMMDDDKTLVSYFGIHFIIVWQNENWIYKKNYGKKKIDQDKGKEKLTN